MLALDGLEDMAAEPAHPVLILPARQHFEPQMIPAGRGDAQHGRGEIPKSAPNPGDLEPAGRLSASVSSKKSPENWRKPLEALGQDALVDGQFHSPLPGNF